MNAQSAGPLQATLPPVEALVGFPDVVLLAPLPMVMPELPSSSSELERVLP
jgi:hypothetical protein